MFDKEMADLHAGASALESVADSAISLITNIGQQLKDLLANHSTGEDPTLAGALEQYATDLTDKANALSAAVVANTPAAPSPIAAEDGSNGIVGDGANQGTQAADQGGDPNASNAATGAQT